MLANISPVDECICLDSERVKQNPGNNSSFGTLGLNVTKGVSSERVKQNPEK